MIWILIWGFILGAILGSFVKSLADRSLSNKSFWGRSYCPHCKKLLRWYDLLPILSHLLLGGRCRYCKRQIEIEYLLVEVVLGILIGFLFWQTFLHFPGFDPFKLTIFISDLVFKIFFISVSSALFLTDLKKMLIPDRLVLPAIIISVIYLILITVFKIGYLYYYMLQTVIGKLLLPPHSDYFQRHALMAAEPLIGSILMALAIGGFFTLLIMVTKEKGMGFGDVKLGALIGLGLGSPQALVATMLSFLAGALFSIAAIILGKKHFGQTIPFGPFLVLGALSALFWGERILSWYLRLTT